MTAHECLMHKWLAGDAAAARTATIEARRYEALRNRLRSRYEVKNSPPNLFLKEAFIPFGCEAAGRESNIYLGCGDSKCSCKVFCAHTYDPLHLYLVVIGNQQYFILTK